MKIWEAIVSTLGMLVLFAAFLVYGSASNTSWGTVKLTDILTIIGGLMFVVPMYLASVRRKSEHHAPNAWIWQGLPVVGMALIIVGLLIPNGQPLWSMFSLPDCFYLIGVLLLLFIPCYPLGALKESMIEDEIEDETDPKAKLV
ncbi:NADH-ubiquinone oxidoreductase chain 6 [Bifidobacterium dolichotidis]|uniref:NADH-ubiquinone oxidoreductase chain 6 n=1 Tax=Bifidobacterium dolichotidis TaxID=2306976 RepID=A0A430FPV0_9BIFI|nr:permease [Bifidobacterium dolichotidis]RSX54860.1 NADH-ubiquinone oxidoreductase chain 6 [Bifidobacterium dolichotidis]